MHFEKKLIKSLRKQKSNYTSPESAIDQANSLESLSTDIYTDSKRFIYELLQNADDASGSSGMLDIQIKLVENYIIVSHNGESFSEVDIESICSVGDGNKKEDENKTGFKGIGFKSVFSHSNYVLIESNNYCFRFDKEYWSDKWKKNWGSQSDWIETRKSKNKPQHIKMPWHIIPIWTELPNQFSFVKDYRVSTIIKYNDVDKLEAELLELFSNSQILLFLRSPEVKISITGQESVIIEKVKESGTVSLKRNGEYLSQWLIKTLELEVDEKLRNLIENDVRIPKKLRQTHRTEISFAVQVENDQINVVGKESRLIFTYLPTSVNYNFPFLTNASFLTDAGRQQIHGDLEWNKWLFKQLPLVLFSWFADLAKTKYKQQIFKLIPDKFNSHLELKQSFDNGLEQAIQTIPFIPNFDGDLLRVQDAIFDSTSISKLLNSKLLIDYLNDKYTKSFKTESLIPHYKPLSTLKRLGVTFFDIDSLDGFFRSSIFKENHKRRENFKLISFLYEQAEVYSSKEKKRNWNDKLRHLPFIFDENKQLKSPLNIYFPAVEFSDEFSDNISIIHPNTITEIESSKKVKKWLSFLGVKEPNSTSFIEKSIIGNTSFITEENAIQIGRYIYAAHKKGSLNDKHYNDLKQLKVLTQGKNMITAQETFLADFYEPELKLESIYETDFYVSKDYYTDNEMKSEWKTFFLKIGVQETIQASEKIYRRKALESKYPKYFEIIPSGVPNHSFGIKNDFYTYKFNLYSFIEKAVEHNFAKKFWTIVLNKNLDILRGNIDLGVCYYPKKIASLNDWIINHSPIFPTVNGKCLPASQVLSNGISKINEIAGHYLPVFDFNDIIPQQWVNYLPFINALKLEDYLTILSAIWQESSENEVLQKENKKRIKLIYSILADNFLGYKDELKYWAQTNKLLSKHGNQYFYPSELAVVTVDGFKASNLAFCDEKNEDMIELLKMFGVKVIDKVTPFISNGIIETTSLKTQIDHVLPLIALVSLEKTINNSDWQKELDKLKNKLSKIHFFEATEIYLSYGNDEDKQKRSTWAKGNDFFYIGNWYKPRILDGLVEPLGKFLGIRYAERFLTVLLTDSFQEGLQYLKEKLGEDTTNIIPEHLRNPEPIIISTASNNTPYNTNDAENGRKGELFVYEELKRIYSKKYQSTIIETDTGFKVKNIVEVIWQNMIKETYKDHDFKIIENGKKIYIDSKATIGGYDSKEPFRVSRGEILLMESAKKYLIARVFNVLSDDKSLKFIRMNLTSID